LCLVVAICVSSGYGASLRSKRQVIPREFANINIENYLKNERAVRFQLKCVVDEGPCDRIGKYLKQTIPELLATQCANCDLAHKDRVSKFATTIQDKFPTEWEKAVKKFQGGLVKYEDAAKLESITGFKLNPNLVAPPTETETKTSEAEVPSTSEVPISSSPAPEPSSSDAPASSSSPAA